MKAFAYLFSPLHRHIRILLISCLVFVALPSHAQEFAVKNIGDYGNVSVMEVSGNYDEDKPDGTSNSVPRQLIAKEFFKNHKDEYDFLVIFTDFDFQMATKNELAFYSHVKNDIRGIGQPIFGMNLGG